MKTTKVSKAISPIMRENGINSTYFIRAEDWRLEELEEYFNYCQNNDNFGTDEAKQEQKFFVHTVYPALKNLRNPQLIELIFYELNKDHKLDNKEKLTAFLFAITGFFNNPRDRKSVALVGDSSVGKDNLIVAIFKHLPVNKALFLTRATNATLEDDISDKKVVAFSELNTKNDDGANKAIVETLKQLAEGGLKAMKKDLQTNNRKTKHSVQEQKCIFYGTTEEKKDHELDTRFTMITVKGYPSKTKTVNDAYLDSCKDIKQMSNDIPPMSWIDFSIGNLLKPLNVYIPFADEIKPLIDNSEPRSQRDLKRLISLAKAYSWIYQEQRDTLYQNDEAVAVVMEVEDFVNVIELAIGFYNQSYKGYDDRKQAIIDLLSEMQPDETDTEGNRWIRRDKLIEKLGVAQNTAKQRIGVLKDKGVVKTKWEGGNSPSFIALGVNLDIKKGLIDVNSDYYKEFKSKKIKKTLTPIDSLLPPNYSVKKVNKMLLTPDFNGLGGNKDKGVKKVRERGTEGINDHKAKVQENFDTLNLTPSISGDVIEESIEEEVTSSYERKLNVLRDLQKEKYNFNSYEVLFTKEELCEEDMLGEKHFNKAKSEGDIQEAKPNCFRVL